MDESNMVCSMEWDDLYLNERAKGWGAKGVTVAVV